MSPPEHPDTARDTAPDPGRAAELRLAVGRLRSRERRARFPVTFHLGVLGGPCEAYAVPPEDAEVLDAALRIDLAGRLLEAHRSRTAPAGAEVVVWLTRPGEPTPQDVDLAWMAATEVALTAAGAPAADCYAITRSGWLDVRTGTSRTWTRLRL